MRTYGKPYATLALLAATLATAVSAQSKSSPPPGSATAAAAVPMPKTDRMPMATFKDLLAKGDVVVIDVRSSESYAAGHIPGALSVPEESITPATAEKLKRMGKLVATYCT